MNPNRQIKLPESLAHESPSQFPLILFQEREDAPPQNLLLHDPLEQPIQIGNLIPSDRGGWHSNSYRSALLSIGDRSIRDSLMSQESLRSINQYFLQNNGFSQDLLQGLFEKSLSMDRQNTKKEETDSDPIKILEKMILKKKKLLTRLIKLKMKVKHFSNSVKIVMNFHKLYLKEKISNRLKQIPEIINEETESIGNLFRKEIYKTEIDLQELKSQHQELTRLNLLNSGLNPSDVQNSQHNFGQPSMNQVIQSNGNCNHNQVSLPVNHDDQSIHKSVKINDHNIKNALNNANQIPTKPQLESNQEIEGDSNGSESEFDDESKDLQEYDDFMSDLESEINSQSSSENLSQQQENHK